MPDKMGKIWQNKIFIPFVLCIIITGISSQSILSGGKKFEPGGKEYTHYNNFKIFKASYFHLIEKKDLYQLHPDDHYDLYKYSPAFALLMAPLAYLPDFLGLTLWNLLNGLLLLFAIRRLPFVTEKNRVWMAGFIFIELITALQNSQSNALIAGLLLMAFLFLEKKQIALASLCIVFTVFIKLFGLVALAIFIFYPDKLKSAFYTLGWTLLLAALPLLVISPSQLSFLYQSWLDMLTNDHQASTGLSVAGWLDSWFRMNLSKNILLLGGAVVLCIPLLKYKFYRDLQFRLFFMSSLLVWMVIFNHKAESPTFIIAVTGIAVWYFSQKKKMINTALLILAFIFTILSPNDLFPKTIRDTYVIPYVLKAVPCILIWLKITCDLLVFGIKKPALNEPAYH